MEAQMLGAINNVKKLTKKKPIVDCFLTYFSNSAATIGTYNQSQNIWD